MNNNVAMDFRNPSVVRKAGMSALKKELGTVGAAYFLRQFATGKGDYTTEREKLQASFTLDEIVKNVRDIEKQY